MSEAVLPLILIVMSIDRRIRGLLNVKIWGYVYLCSIGGWCIKV